MAGGVKYSKEYKEERLALAQENKRRCNTCHKIKELTTEFSKDPSGANGRQSRCKQCGNDARNRTRRTQDPLVAALENGYYRAKNAGLPAEWIEPEELYAYWEKNGIDPNTCFYTGVELTHERGVPNEFNLEHKFALSSENTPGHVLENLVPACWEFNSHKGTTRPVVAFLNAPEELRPVLEYEGDTDELGNPTAPAVIEREQTQEQRTLRRRGE